MLEFAERQDTVERHVVDELSGLEQDPSLRVLHAGLDEVKLGGASQLGQVKPRWAVHPKAGTPFGSESWAS